MKGGDSDVHSNNYGDCGYNSANLHRNGRIVTTQGSQVKSLAPHHSYA